MKIDYTVPENSKYFLFLDLPYRQVANHSILAFSGDRCGLSLAERVTHFVMALLKSIPLFGHLITLVDTFYQSRFSVVCIKLHEIDPFRRGKEHGEKLKKRIKEVYEPVLAMKSGIKNIRENCREFEAQIPGELREEMRGLAEGAGYSYDDVLFIHSFLDADPGHYGCTSMVAKGSGEQWNRLVASNHSINDEEEAFFPSGDSQIRRDAFLQFPIGSSDAPNKILEVTGKNETIQSMVFDTNNLKISLSAQGSSAANGRYSTFTPELLFESQEEKSTDSEHQVKLFRNLDWPWYFLGQETILLSRKHSNGKKTVLVTWPGYIGTLSGMNNSGLAITQNQHGSSKNLQGIPNPLLFTHILDKCHNIYEADRKIRRGEHGSSMNVVVADPTGGKSYELQGEGIVACVGTIS